MTYEQIRLEVENTGIATVTLAHAPVNALNRRTREEITHVFDAISDREDIRVAILTGEGKVFCAGADIKERVNLVQEPGDYLRHNRQARETFLSIMDCAKPVIAAVNGPAIGAGLALMLASDIALASDDLMKVPEAIALSKATMRNIRQNVTVALVTVGVLLAGVLAGQIHMAGGMLVHEASVLVVILNGMRLLGGAGTLPRARRGAAIGDHGPARQVSAP